GGIGQDHAAHIVANGHEVGVGPVGGPQLPVAVIALGVILFVDPDLLGAAAALGDLLDRGRVGRVAVEHAVERVAVGIAGRVALRGQLIAGADQNFVVLVGEL